jgi:hypothetical protein
MLHRIDIDTAINRGYEEIARLQLEIAKRSRMSGDVTIFNKKQMVSTRLYAYITAIIEIPFNHDSNKNEVIERLYNRIKLITKDLRQWD